MPNNWYKKVVELYHDLIVNKIFNKTLLLYGLITIITITLLSLIISQSVSSILEKQELIFNGQIVQTLNQYFETTCSNVKKLHQEILENDTLNADVMYLLNYNGNKFDSKYIETNNGFITSVTQELGFNTDVRYIYLYNLKTNKNYMFPNSYNYPYTPGDISPYLESVKQNSIESKNYERLYILPGTASANGANNIFALYDYIRNSSNPSDIQGSMILDYNCNQLCNAYSKYSKYLKGYLMILTSDGHVVFDSSGKNYGTVSWVYKLFSTNQSETIRCSDCLINVERDNLYGFTTVGVIPYDELYIDINKLKREIVIITSVCMAVMIFLSYVSTKRLLRHLRVVINGIKCIQNGNLKIRLDETNKDEIGSISHSLNLMCQKLTEYIDREYLSNIRLKDAELNRHMAELRQKDAEFCMFQSQINPHFLYNTLEVIRMKAIVSGQHDVSQMITILSTILRSSIKSDMVVCIRDELDFLKSYMEMYCLHFENSLKFEFKIDPDILKYGILRHLLQPVVENAIIHGIYLDRGDNVISVAGKLDNGDIILEVHDNGKGMENEDLEKLRTRICETHLDRSEGIGLINVNSRIRMIYGNDHGLSIWSCKNEGTRVTIKVAAKKKEELELYVQGNDR